MMIRARFLPALLALVTAAPTIAQSASVTYYGTACTFALPFGVHGLPRLGSTIEFETLAMATATGRVYSKAAIAIGASDQAIGGVPLPIPLTAFSQFWCGEILQSSEAYLPAPPGTWPQQTVTVPLTIPNAPSLLGMTFFAQAFIAAYSSGYTVPGANPSILASDAARLVIGL